MSIVVAAARWEVRRAGVVVSLCASHLLARSRAPPPTPFPYPSRVRFPPFSTLSSQCARAVDRTYYPQKLPLHR